MNRLQLLDYLKKTGFSYQIINAFKNVRREDFIPEESTQYAYEDTALSIGSGQTISQPSTIAMMLTMLDLKKGQKVLEIGSGCGYALALMSDIIGEKGKVYGIEIIKELADKSKENLKNYSNIKLYHADASKELPKKLPSLFERILISASVEEIPKTLLSRLKNNGIIVAPVGPQHSEQSLVAVQRKKDEYTIKHKKSGFVFVPFIQKNDKII